jgi:hypothetical protein
MPRTVATAITVSLFSALLAAAFPLNAAQGSTGMVEPAGITLSTNEVLYVLGEAVQVTVQVQPPLDLNNLLRFSIYTPGGDTFRIAEFAINNDGHFVWTFDLPQSEAGQWTINAKFSTKDAEATIDVLEAGVFDKVFIESAALFDVRGNEMASGEGRVGESIAVTATLVNDEQVSQPYMFIVQIIGDDGAASSLLLMLGTLMPGQSANPSVSWLPREQGAYTAEIFVWSSLSSPAPLIEKHTVAFSIT